MAELRREALAAQPPAETGRDATPDLVELTALDSTISLEIRYASDNNLYGTPFYSQARAFLQRPAAEAVARVHRALAAYGLGLRIHDGYRPWYVTKMFWDAASPAVRPFVADPSKGSKHNRGAAVDLALYDRRTGATVPMPSTYDETTMRAYPDWPGGSARERWARDLLRRLMEREGFTVFEFEWWHFDYRGWEHWPILNIPFERLGIAGRAAR
ncbi:MAG: M15 family metallopeptidase [Gemmatimonadetes bacterium]|nr:M15 family metallopeptidase [Gemmatimonadota bacterium]